MKALETIQKTRDYLDYLEEHILNVQRAWKETQEACKGMSFMQDKELKDWIDKEIINHDLTKLSEHEFVQYRKKFHPCEHDKNVPYEQPFEQAWNHHLMFNDHHWQTWTNGDYLNPNEMKGHCVHMIVDWMAMGYKFDDNAKSYYEANKEKIYIPDHMIPWMYEIFNNLYPEGVN